MRLQQSFAFHVGSVPKLIELLAGDLASIPEHDPVDVLVVSAFAGDYTPTPTSVIGALDRAGVSVAELARAPEYDLRRYWHSWLSAPVRPGLGFGRLLCFETPDGRTPGEALDGIFRSLAPFVGETAGVRTVAMPLIGTGDQGAAVDAVLPAQLEAAYEALRTTALSRVAVVVRDEARAAEVRPLFEAFKRSRLGAVDAGGRLPPAYDVFLSYSHANEEDAATVQEALLEAKPDIRLFRDLESLRGGRDYRVQLDDALRRTQRVVVLYSPEYLASTPCQDEFNTAWALHKRGHDGLLAPLFVRRKSVDRAVEITSQLDHDRRRVTLHWAKCYEGDEAAIRRECARVVAQLAPAAAG